MRAFLLATSAGPRARLMLPRGMLSGVECPVTSKYVASPASRGSCDFDRRESRATVWKGASASFHSTLAFSIQKPNCPGGAGSCSPADGRGGARRTGRAGGLDLSPGGRRNRHQGGSEHPSQEDVLCWFHRGFRYWCVSFSPALPVPFG
jgi:hypothetical protein